VWGIDSPHIHYMKYKYFKVTVLSQPTYYPEVKNGDWLLMCTEGHTKSTNLSVVHAQAEMIVFHGCRSVLKSVKKDFLQKEIITGK